MEGMIGVEDLVWTKDSADDEVFKIHHREYKRRFAWIKVGGSRRRNFTLGASQPARKRQCDAGTITLEAYQQ